MGWWGGITQKWDVIESGRLRVSECSKHSIFMLFIKENWICTMAGYHIEPNINILLIRYLPFDSNVIQWSHLLTMALYYLWSKPNNRTRSQFECDMTCFCFCFYLFIHMYDTVVVPKFVYVFKFCKLNRLIPKRVVKM